MKAISLKQPYASWVADGFKTIETRTWRTKYRGPLLICSSKTFDEDFDPNDSAFGDGLPLGMALAIVNLVNCRPMTEKDENLAHCDFYEGAVAWILSDIKKIAPFPVKGQLSIFEVPFPLQQPEVAA
jgi:hypothetical protein